MGPSDLSEDLRQRPARGQQVVVDRAGARLISIQDPLFESCIEGASFSAGFSRGLDPPGHSGPPVGIANRHCTPSLVSASIGEPYGAESAAMMGPKRGEAGEAPGVFCVNRP